MLLLSCIGGWLALNVLAGGCLVLRRRGSADARPERVVVRRRSQAQEWLRPTAADLGWRPDAR